jgi:hypothetical protein
MRRSLVWSLLVLGAAVSGLTWACVTSPSFSTSKLQGPTLITVGSQGLFKLTAVRTSGKGEDDTASATWDVTPSAVARLERPGVVTGLAEGLATVTATMDNTVATLPLRILVAGDYHVTGTVRDASGNPIGGASVATTGTPFSQTTTDANGIYNLSNIYGLTTLHVSVGSFTSDRQINVNANMTSVDFTLPVPAGFINVTGLWTTTFNAPAGCAASLPEAARQRTYSVTISQSVSSLTFRFSAPSVAFSPTFSAVMNANGLTLRLVTDSYDYYYYGPFSTTLLDKLAPGQWLDVKGVITIPTLSATVLTGTLAGEFDYYEGNPALNLPATGTPNVRCQGSTSVTLARIVTPATQRIRR